MINQAIYEKYMRQYILEAIENSDGSNRGIAEHLSTIHIRRFLVRDREEKRRALEDARRAFDEHRHWPREIILRQLGILLLNE